MSEDDRVASIIEGESVTAHVELTTGKNKKVIVSVKVVADLDKLDKVPEMCVGAIKNVYDKASEIGINLH